MGIVLTEAAGQHRQRRAQPLAAAGQHHRQHRSEQRVVRLSRLGQRALDRRQTILNQGERRDSADHSIPLSLVTTGCTGTGSVGNSRFAFSVVALLDPLQRNAVQLCQAGRRRHRIWDGSLRWPRCGCGGRYGQSVSTTIRSSGVLEPASAARPAFLYVTRPGERHGETRLEAGREHRLVAREAVQHAPPAGLARPVQQDRSDLAIGVAVVHDHRQVEPAARSRWRWNQSR